MYNSTNNIYTVEINFEVNGNIITSDLICVDPNTKTPPFAAFLLDKRKYPLLLRYDIETPDYYVLVVAAMLPVYGYLQPYIHMPRSTRVEIIEYLRNLNYIPINSNQHPSNFQIALLSAVNNNLNYILERYRIYNY